MNYKNVDLTAFTNFLENIKDTEIYPEEHHSSHGTIMMSFITQLSGRLNRKAKVLDIGCGNGYAMELFNERGFETTGITIGEEDYNVCKEKNLNVHIMDQSFLTFPDNTFDLIWCRHCLEHSIMPFFTLLGFYRVLKNKGEIYIEVPYPDTCFDHQDNLNHYSVFPRSSWISLIKRSKFKIIDTSDINLKSTIQIKDCKDKYLAILAGKMED